MTQTISRWFGRALVALTMMMPLFLTDGMATVQAASPYTTPVTTITVNSGKDLDTSNSTTCATSPCTLRRAVIQARNLPANQKPVLIAFNIPATAAEGYNSTLQIWKIQFIGISSSTMADVRYLNGGIIIDGSTQPGGRTTGPKIILVGPGTGQWRRVEVGRNRHPKRQRDSRAGLSDVQDPHLRKFQQQRHRE